MVKWKWSFNTFLYNIDFNIYLLAMISQVRFLFQCGEKCS